MSFFNAAQLLAIAAREYQLRRETFSTAEIVSRINEIKYLSTQKKVPKLSLRKEIIHLETKLQTVLNLEQRMLKQKHRESAKEKMLKKQVAELKNRLAAAHNKDVQKKLDRITGLLGDYVAKKRTEEEVRAAIAQLKGIEKEKAAKSLKTTATAQQPESSLSSVQDEQPRIAMLQQRLRMLKGEWELLKILKKDNLARGMEEKIALLEEKLEKYRKPAAIGSKLSLPVPEIKHTMFFSSPKPVQAETADEDLELGTELPLPPPPKMKRKM